MLWPILAIAMVGIAGAALFLVWKQMKQQPPAVVNITSEPSQVVTRPEPPAPGSAAVAPGSDAPTIVAEGSAKVPKRVTPAPEKAAPKRGSYDQAIQANKTRIAQCAKDHGAPPSNAKVVIVVTTTGKARTISLEPTDLNGSPLGACIKNVLSGAKYPTAAAEMQVSVALKS